MGARGPLPLPSNVRQLRGNPGHRAPKPTVKAAPVPPSAPTWLGREAKAEWRRIVVELEKLGILGRLDRAVLTAYCDVWEKWVGARAELEADGLLVDGYRGSRVKSPAWQVYRDAATQLAALAKEIGATPAVRLRMTLPDDPEADEGEGILD